MVKYICRNILPRHQYRLPKITSKMAIDHQSYFKTDTLLFKIIFNYKFGGYRTVNNQSLIFEVSLYG